MKKFILILFLSFTFGACSTERVTKLSLPSPLVPKKQIAQKNKVVPTQTNTAIKLESALTTQQESEPYKSIKKTKFYTTPSLPEESITEQKENIDTNLPKLKGDAITINVDSLPIPAFINEVFGNLLQLSFEISPDLKNKKDLITLRITKPETPTNIYLSTKQVLQNYGISIVQQNQLIRFIISNNTNKTDTVPLLVTGESAPNIPKNNRPVFQFVPLKIVRNIHIAGWLRTLYQGQNLEISEDSYRNSIILKGTPHIVKQAVLTVKALDRPLMRGRYSIRIEPAYLSASELAANLKNILKTEGYSVGQSGGDSESLIIMPLNKLDMILVFSADKNLLNHVKSWALQLDKPEKKKEDENKEDKIDQALFFYTMKHTAAESIEPILTQLMGYSVSSQNKKRQVNTKNQAIFPNAHLIADEVRNSLIFYGARESWMRLLPVIQRMDIPEKQTLLEVTIAEITLTDQSQLGIEWLLNNIGIGDFKGTLGTHKGLALKTGGLTYSPVSKSGSLAIISALTSNTNVNVLSTPRVMVRSGQQATIDVGQEVPIVTSQNQSTVPTTTTGQTGIFQQIQYRRTGVLLNVKPVVHSGNRINLEITQESSNAEKNEVSDISSPVIFNRRIETNLTLEDGEAILLGGLISKSRTNGESKVPLLGDLPIVGNLFKTTSGSGQRSELIMLITPYIINDGREAKEITDSFKDQLDILTIDTTGIITKTK